MVANGLLQRATANLVFLQELVEYGAERLGRAFFRTWRFFRRHTTQFADESFGEFAELVRLIGHNFF